MARGLCIDECSTLATNIEETGWFTVPTTLAARSTCRDLIIVRVCLCVGFGGVTRQEAGYFRKEARSDLSIAHVENELALSSVRAQ